MRQAKVKATMFCPRAELEVEDSPWGPYPSVMVPIVLKLRYRDLSGDVKSTTMISMLHISMRRRRRTRSSSSSCRHQHCAPTWTCWRCVLTALCSVYYQPPRDWLAQCRAATTICICTGLQQLSRCPVIG